MAISQMGQNDNPPRVARVAICGHTVCGHMTRRLGWVCPFHWPGCSVVLESPESCRRVAPGRAVSAWEVPVLIQKPVRSLSAGHGRHGMVVRNVLKLMNFTKFLIGKPLR